MIKPIMKNVSFLRRKSTPATERDLTVGQDLLDTLRAHKNGCVGMAANMIGVTKRVIVVTVGFVDVVMYNPVILSAEGPYTAQEGCLSLEGVRTAKRYQTIEVQYRDSSWRECVQRFSGLPAQIIQHEIDHLSGIII